MRGKGITYDTGFLSAGTSTHEPFDADIVRREMQIIHDDLHCNVVRITGGLADRLEIAAQHAYAAGLEVWFCPFTNGLTMDGLLEVLVDCAERAERLRRRGAEVVLFTGSEVSLFTTGFFPGETLGERLAIIADPLRARDAIPTVRARMKDFMSRAVEVVRGRFAGKISYASLPHERIDWGLFDIIATDAGYRTAVNAARYRDQIRAFVAQGRSVGKAVAITEFGCMTFRGSAGRNDGELTLIEWGSDGRPEHLKDEFVRDETEQANYLCDLLDVFEAEGVDSAFVYTFARYDLRHNAGRNKDFDLVSRGIVTVVDPESVRGSRRYPEMAWEPKAAFDALAAYYSR